MSHQFFIDSVIGTVLFSAALDGTAFVQNYVNIPDQLLCCIAGGVLGGLGGALVYRSESFTGGVDIIGFLTKKYYNISVSTTNFLFDSCVMLAAVVFLGLTPVLYSMVLFFITFQATNVFMVGFDYKKQVIIVSTHADERGESGHHHSSRRRRIHPEASGDFTCGGQADPAGPPGKDHQRSGSHGLRHHPGCQQRIRSGIHPAQPGY